MSRTHRHDPLDDFEKAPVINVTRCGTTHKVCFDSHQAALTRAGEILEQNYPNGEKTFSAYPCVYCGAYHLTSRPKL